jgi:hypothetical protein
MYKEFISMLNLQGIIVCRLYKLCTNYLQYLFYIIIDLMTLEGGHGSCSQPHLELSIQECLYKAWVLQHRWVNLKFVGFFSFLSVSSSSLPFHYIKQGMNWCNESKFKWNSWELLWSAFRVFVNIWCFLGIVSGVCSCFGIIPILFILVR